MAPKSQPTGSQKKTSTRPNLVKLESTIPAASPKLKRFDPLTAVRGWIFLIMLMLRSNSSRRLVLHNPVRRVARRERRRQKINAFGSMTRKVRRYLHFWRSLTSKISRPSTMGGYIRADDGGGLFIKHGRILPNNEAGRAGSSC